MTLVRDSFFFSLFLLTNLPTTDPVLHYKNKKDLEEIGLRVKHTNIVTRAEGFILEMKGQMLWAQDPVAAERFYNLGSSHSLFFSFVELFLLTMFFPLI